MLIMNCSSTQLFDSIAEFVKVGTIAPKKFIARLRKEKVEFDNYMQQDAHEFLIFLINHINEIIVGEQPAPSKTLGPGQTSRPNESPPTWINDIFQVSF